MDLNKSSLIVKLYNIIGLDLSIIMIENLDLVRMEVVDPDPAQNPEPDPQPKPEVPEPPSGKN
jgi:hypothetical protein